MWEQPETGYKKFNSEMMFKCPVVHLDVKADGKVMSSGSLDYKYTIEYKRPKRDTTTHKIVASQVQKIEKEGDVMKISSVSTLSSSWYPDWNYQSTYAMTKSTDLLENRFNVKYGATKKTLDFLQITKVTEGDKYTTDLSVDMPEFKFKEEARITYQNRFQSGMFLGKLEWPTFKNFEGELNLRNSNDNLWKMQAEAKVKYTGREMRIFTKLDEVSPQTYKSNAILQWQTGKQIEVNSDIKLKSQRGIYEYEIDAEAKMSGQPDTITFRKAIRVSRSETKYIALARKGTESLYDFKMDMIKESDTKTNFQTHLKSDWMGRLDYAVAGHVDSQPETTTVVARVKKDNKDWMKGEVIVPYRLSGRQVRAKAHLFWDMHTRDRKEAMADYRLTRTGSGNQHDWKVKIKAEPANYLWEAKVMKSEYYTMNSTITKNNRPLIEAHWGGKVDHDRHGMVPRDLAIDFKLRTHAPMTPQHFTGLITHSHGPRDFKTAGYFRCHRCNKRVGFDFQGKWDIVGRHGRKYWSKSMMKYNEKEWSHEKELTIPNINDWWSISGKGKTKISWESNKEVIFNQEIQTGTVGFYKATLMTPFPKLSEMQADIRVENMRTNPKLSMQFDWNKSKRIFAEITGDVSKQKSLDMNFLVETSFDGLKKLEGKLKYDFLNNWDVETWVKWNNEGRMKFVHKSTNRGGKNTIDMSLECVIPRQVNWIGAAGIEYDSSQGTYTAECELKLGRDEYKLDADVNTKRKTGSIKLETPLENLNSAEITVTKSGSNEYKIQTQRNDQEGGSITALLKMEEGDHVLKFEVDNVQYPFSVIYEGQYNDRRWHIKSELNIQPNTANKKSYGLLFKNEQKSLGKRETQFLFRHPRRQMMLKFHRDSSQAGTYKFNIEIQ